MVALLALTGIAAVISLLAILRGFTLALLWNWFIVSVFGLHQITIPQAIGLCLISGLLTYSGDREKFDAAKKKAGVGEALLGMLLYYVSFIGFGYIVHLFI
jgi:hypothetical protein